MKCDECKRDSNYDDYGTAYIKTIMLGRRDYFNLCQYCAEDKTITFKDESSVTLDELFNFFKDRLIKK